MPYINQLPLLDSVTGGDQLPVYNTNNGDARRLPISALLTYFQESFAAPTVATNLYTPSTGFNITVPTPVSEQQWIILQPAGTLATGTVTLPLNTGVPDGTTVFISSTQQITSFTIALNGATAVFGALTSLPAGASTVLRFYRTTNSWYQINTDAVYGAGVAAWLATPSSANLAAAVTGETGTGALVFATSPALVTPVLGDATATTVTTTGNIVVSGTGKQGYATGSGGTVTQGSGSGKATAVTLSKTNGSITTDAASLAAGTVVSFVLTNTTIEAGDVLILNHISGGTAGAYTLNAQSAAGSATINIRNATAGALAEAIVLRFAVIKAVSA